MNAIEHYIDLRHIYPNAKENIPLTVSIVELAQTLCCSLRNVKHLLKKMESSGFILWEPGKGRGNRSKLTFKLSLGTVVIFHFKDLLNKGKVDQGIHLIHRQGVPDNVRNICFNLLQSQYRSSTHHTQEKEDFSRTPSHTFPITSHLVREIDDTSPWFISTRLSNKSSFIWPNHGNLTDF